MTRTFRRHKETKGTWQYREEETDGAIMSGAIYIKKGALVELAQSPGVAPEEITVTVAEV